MSEALTVRDLTIQLGGRTVLDRFEMHVGAGEVYGFLGPNGSGKTTALRAILGLLPHVRGDIRIDGRPASPAARSRVGAVVDVPAFHSAMSGVENLNHAARLAGLGRADAAKECDRVLERVGLRERARDAASAYSLGMRQRLGLARALLGRPSLVLLDEPTNGLDPAGVRQMRDTIRSLAHDDGLTVLMSSHHLAEVQSTATHVGILRGGRLVAEGAVARLLARPHVEVEVTAEPDAVARAVVHLDTVELLDSPGVGRVRLRLVGMTVPELVRRLVERGIDVHGLSAQARTLEDLYLELV